MKMVVYKFPVKRGEKKGPGNHLSPHSENNLATRQGKQNKRRDSLSPPNVRNLREEKAKEKRERVGAAYK